MWQTELLIKGEVEIAAWSMSFRRLVALQYHVRAANHDAPGYGVVPGLGRLTAEPLAWTRADLRWALYVLRGWSGSYDSRSSG
ncbi:hypothetical protein [Actinoplanes regularis]|uniref:Uncharacterized protein n=1 Tax=Actinoplanes regularis TaxID=52697 RepID=A0A239D6K6_9ACTN|nr:hypothetical protein [Actinoplanes regularis]GIE88667.1 hypothetical protein Are01nite_51470 [Actinoplanes regularis]SNS27648.1 hypothetical protein SAMN06264365_1131 [Actinoplanes regularis]